MRTQRGIVCVERRRTEKKASYVRIRKPCSGCVWCVMSCYCITIMSELFHTIDQLVVFG